METQIVKIETGSTTLRFVISWLESIGCALKNPTSKEISGYLSGKGKIVYTEEEFNLCMQEQNTGTVQLWYAESSDIFLSWDKNEVVLYFDGVEFEMRRKVLMCLVDKFTIPYESGSMLDWKMTTEYYQ
ncbi:hypothetical protein SAMN02745181_3594 [Rubritalea squalenifaciens DSM 18772]|uniref:Uncharacterized protein n=1 Tax=Rubritalea squalenifaciens DSM 18772 TaxID=1123071 RepID=A0A1M6RB68_9BACT|nr:hypothetical protein [Rubritalea squalenifaciens]SHK29682.1 hypothetical protein SAMN02745181_3594 [Rubritalea squalenifaciens DSM 18772]